MREWLGRIAGVLCIMTIMLQLLPEGSFGKYVKFYASLLYLLVAVGPVLRLFTQEDLLERFLRLELLKEEHYDLESAVTGLKDLKNEMFRKAYEQELICQFGEIAQAYGAFMENARICFKEDDTLQEVKIKICAEDETAADAAEKIRREIAGIYGLAQDKIQIEEAGAG